MYSNMFSKIKNRVMIFFVNVIYARTFVQLLINRIRYRVIGRADIEINYFPLEKKIP